jgi:hypothetical protein
MCRAHHLHSILGDKQRIVFFSIAKINTILILAGVKDNRRVYKFDGAKCRW